MRRGACGLADLLDFEEEGGSFSFISSKSARPCSARPEQTRRVACLQGCFFAELAHTRPATASREPVEPPRAGPEAFPPALALTHPQSAGRSVGEAATAGRRTKRCLCREGCLCVAFFRCAKLCASQRQSSWAVALPAPEALIACRHIRRDTYWQPTAGPRKKCADLCPVATCLWGQILRWQCSACS